MERYISQFEGPCDKLEESKQGLAEEQKKHIFTINIQDNTYDTIWYQYEISDFVTTVLLIHFKKKLNWPKPPTQKDIIEISTTQKQITMKKHNYSKKKKYHQIYLKHTHTHTHTNNQTG